MALEGTYSEEVQAMQLEIDPFLAVGEGLRTPAQKEAIELCFRAKHEEEYEDPALRVRVDRQSELIRSRYESIDIQPNVLFDLIQDEAGMPADIARTTYFYFVELNSGVSRYPQNGRKHTHVSVGLYTPHQRALDLTSRRVEHEEKEVVNYAPADDGEWLERWRDEQYQFENKRILQAEVGIETARIMKQAVNLNDENLKKAQSRYRRIVKSVGVGGIAGLSYATAGNPPELPLFLAGAVAYSASWLVTAMAMRQAGIYTDPVERQERGFARDMMSSSATRELFSRAVNVKPKLHQDASH